MITKIPLLSYCGDNFRFYYLFHFEMGIFVYIIVITFFAKSYVIRL